MAKTIEYKRPDGKTVKGYLAEPAAGSKAPGMVVIQEWWGMNDQIRGVADKLAAAGYRALVPDLYRGKSTVEAKEAEHLMKGLNFGDAAGQDIRGAVQFLKKDSPKVGVTGFCMGGALTVLSVANVPEAGRPLVAALLRGLVESSGPPGFLGACRRQGKLEPLDVAGQRRGRGDRDGSGGCSVARGGRCRLGCRDLAGSFGCGVGHVVSLFEIPRLFSSIWALP